MLRFDPRYKDIGPKPPLDLFCIGTLEEQLDCLSQVGSRLFDRCPLASQLTGHGAAYTSLSFSVIAAYTVVAIPILPAATEMCSAARIRSYREGRVLARGPSAHACRNVSGVLHPWLPRRCHVGQHCRPFSAPPPGPSS